LIICYILYIAAKRIDCDQFENDLHVLFNASKGAVILYNETQQRNSANGNVMQRYDNETHMETMVVSAQIQLIYEMFAVRFIVMSI